MEKALLVGRKGEEDSIKELASLATTAGARVVKEILLRLQAPNPAFFVGKGQAEEISHLAEEHDVDLVIFDNELNPVQQRNLEECIGRRVIDRTQLIMDIFAQHAHTEEGKIEVELAQLMYLLPRLTGKGVELSRLGGGIGTRGPGEKKLEYDRRRIKGRIQHLKRRISKASLHREVLRRRREKRGVPTIAIVGYTNSGKTTLLNTLTHSQLPSGDKLFLTLDTRMRKLFLPNHQVVILVDTVGFIRRLPHQLLTSFKATLQEVVYADILLEVIDASHPQREEMRKAVREVLRELEVLDKPLIQVLNKVDLLNKFEKARLKRKFPEGVLVSALTGEGISQLKERIMKELENLREEVEVFLPLEKLSLLSLIHNHGKILEERMEEEGVRVKALVEPKVVGKIKDYLATKV